MEGHPVSMGRHPDSCNEGRWLLNIRVTRGIGPGRIAVFGDSEDVFRDFDELYRRVRRRYLVSRGSLRSVWEDSFSGSDSELRA